MSTVKSNRRRNPRDSLSTTACGLNRLCHNLCSKLLHSSVSLTPPLSLTKCLILSRVFLVSVVRNNDFIVNFLSILDCTHILYIVSQCSYFISL